jgi:hypothetical protein
MKIVITENQYKNLLLEYNHLTTDEMEEYVRVYFESIERYQDMIRKLVRIWSNNRVKDVTFSWYPKFNSERAASFSYQSKFAMYGNRHGSTTSDDTTRSYKAYAILQFNFDIKYENKSYKGDINAYTDGKFLSDRKVWRHMDMTPLAYDQNYSKINTYLKQFFSSPQLRELFRNNLY